MSEEFLHYLWQNKLYLSYPLHTCAGEAIEVIHPGDANHHAGPDFFNAKIKIGDTLWAGNVEIHLRSADWYVHKHQEDLNYDNVILHVVLQKDRDVYRTNGEEIPTLELRYSSSLLHKYEQLKNAAHPIACASQISDLSDFYVSAWLQRLLIEKLENKVERINLLLQQTSSNWDETFYRLLARNMGFGVNSDPMEQLAMRTPLSVLLKYCDSVFQQEAILFGQAGFLNNEDISDDYYINLQKEYLFLKQKHKLKPLENHVWKFLRLRPANFPTIRLAQLAQLIVKIKGLFGELLDGENLKDILHQLSIQTSQYWEQHHQFGKPSPKSIKKLGDKSKELIIINTILPYLFSYGHVFGNNHYQQKAVDWYAQIKPEKNSVVTRWQEIGVQIKNAGDAQAAIFLYNSYCQPKKCLLCSIGHKLLATSSEER